jgi:hypothetical protein
LTAWPERPVEGHGPVPQLARELRKIRSEAGTPGYREMAGAARFSVETLSAAARGTSCPSWEVTKAFADVCDPTGASGPWAPSSVGHGQQGQPTAFDSPPPARARRAPPGRPARPSPASCPKPDPGGTPAQYVYGLRVWAGGPSRHETAEVDAIVLGCTELPLIMEQGQCAAPLVDTARVFAHAALDKALGADAGR